MANQPDKQQNSVSKALVAAANEVLEATDMGKWKDLTSRIIISFLVNEPSMADGEATEAETYHFYMTRFFNNLKEVQQSKLKTEL